MHTILLRNLSIVRCRVQVVRSYCNQNQNTILRPPARLSELHIPNLSAQIRWFPLKKVHILLVHSVKYPERYKARNQWNITKKCVDLSQIPTGKCAWLIFTWQKKRSLFICIRANRNVIFVNVTARICWRYRFTGCDSTTTKTLIFYIK